jgi:hypothetical protein
MIKLIKINVLIFLITLVVLILFIVSLNYILSGVPIYRQLNIKLEDIIQIKLKNDKYKDTIQNIDINEFLNKSLIIEKCGITEDGIYNLFYNPDKFNFRNNENFYDKTDVILLGDSFTYSACINEPNDFASQLRILSNKKILNLGVSGTAIYSQFLNLKKFTQNTQYQTIIHLFYEGNDFEETRENVKITNYLSRTVEQSNVANILVEKRLNQNIYYIKIKIFLAEHLRGLNTLIGYFKKYPILLNYNDHVVSVKELANYLDDNKIIDRYVYYIPKYTRIALNKVPNHPQVKQLDDLRFSVKKIYEENNFKFIDGVEEFKKSNKDLLIFNYELPTHFNKIGQREMALHIYNFIK